ncbi:50S ribosomal protein L37ae [Candidatus Woesearchaeota archaeon B3_Woes]|nr:MAG: 50S ribosomal protein L37ae [Candidatus Woesearchaeota archaeon B3_Woes]
MAAKKQKRKKSSTKRFGPRYGRRLKEKVAEIESGHRGRHICPYCSKKNVRREAAGIWFCKSCKVKFAGRAYSIGKKRTVKEEEKVIKSEEKPSDSKEDKK